jgi:glycosyltransferase involved in cell wall biosynthesis
MSAAPLVSILTPSFNQGRWLVDNLESVACQTYPYIEHIVMDGGSADDSLDALASAGPAVTWRSEPDKGQPDALNKAFDASNGTVVGWLNSDDALFDCRVVEDVVAYFEAHPAVDVVYGHAAQISSEGRIISYVGVPRFSKELLKLTCYLAQPAVFIRRRAIADRFIDVSFQYAMDWELWLRLAETYRFGRIDRVLAVDRLQPERKRSTWLSVYERDYARLTSMYGMHLPWYFGGLNRVLHVCSRIHGARFALRRPDRLAFSGPQDSRGDVLRRQLLSRRAKWPAEWR